MKSKLIKLATVTALVGLIGMSTFGCNKKDKADTTTKVKLNEVVRSVFYAPMYVAINEGCFEDERLEIDLTTGQGADTTHSYTQYI
ncbi:ABC transporter substrate-binding protein [Clostridium septicum]|uniref:ABC transporter substrate-binding protein n=1 Tax=Clostridium septicum TaxID=1504 RepID=UPI0013E8B032|nr:ABC transporter substrate-binding protein [Clostridium septicum]